MRGEKFFNIALIYSYFYIAFWIINIYCIFTKNGNFIRNAFDYNLPGYLFFLGVLLVVQGYFSYVNFFDTRTHGIKKYLPVSAFVTTVIIVLVAIYMVIDWFASGDFMN